MKQEIIKKINQDNQSSAQFSSQIHCKCNEPNMGGKWDLLLDFTVHELKATIGTV
jgi:hypothetical protein